MSPRVGLFREAAARRGEPRDALGSALHLEPSWVSRAYWIVLAAITLAAAALTLGRADGYASGPGVLRATGSSEVPVESDGVVTSVRVAPGTRVRAGDALLTLDDHEERAQVATAEEAYEVALARVLRARGHDESGSVAERQSLRDLARTRLAARTVRSPRDALVTDVLVEAGQAIARGVAVVALSEESGRPRVVALLPAAHAPELAVGATLRLELTGHPFANQTLRVARVGMEALGESDARRALGRTAEAVQLEGPSVLVEAELPAAGFSSGSRRLPYRDGMPARVQVTIRREPLVLVIAPWLRSLLAEDT